MWSLGKVMTWVPCLALPPTTKSFILTFLLVFYLRYHVPVSSPPSSLHTKAHVTVTNALAIYTSAPVTAASYPPRWGHDCIPQHPKTARKVSKYPQVTVKVLVTSGQTVSASVSNGVDSIWITNTAVTQSRQWTTALLLIQITNN